MKITGWCLLIIIPLVSSCLSIGANVEPKEGLVIYFSFDKIEGDEVVNEAGNGIKGKLEGKARQVPGYKDMGIALNAEADEGAPGDDFVRVTGSPEVNVTDQITVAVWVKATNFGDYRTVMSNTDGSGYALSVENGVPTGWVHVNGDYLHVIGKTKLEEDTWYHLALTFDGNDGIIYLNGEEEAKGTRKGKITASSSDFFIGAEPSGNSIDHSYPAWHGILDEFYFYDRALSKEEINLLIKVASPVKSIDKLATCWGRIKR